jgi:nitrile hydratase subunit beta
MDAIHDLGGKQGFGTVEIEPDEPVFHEPWERSVFVAVLGVLRGGIGNNSQFRHAMERMDPVHYLAGGYYERWMTGIATLLAERGVVSQADLEARAGGPFPLAPTPEVKDVPDAQPDADAARFAPGDRVRVVFDRPSWHTRCPEYVRGRAGEVVAVRGTTANPAIEVHRNERTAEQTYSVRFEGSELWGSDAEPGTSIVVDLFQSYLEPA